MTIREYLDTNSLTVTKFADDLGVGRVMVHRWISGDAVPSLESATKIVELTGGSVTTDDLLAPSRARTDDYIID